MATTMTARDTSIKSTMTARDTSIKSTMTARDTSIKSTMTISKAVGVFKSKHSCDMVDRHIRAVNRVAAINKNGFLLQDLGGLYELLSIMNQQFKTCTEYQEPLIALLKLCGKPFLKKKATDENNYATDVLQLFALLGHIAVITNDSIRQIIAKSLASFYTAKVTGSQLGEGILVTKPSFGATLLERSAVAKRLVETVAACEDIDTRTEILSTIQILSTSAINCNHMLSVGIGRYLCEVIAVSQNKPSSRLTFIGTEILWNLLENGSSMLVEKELSNIECVSTLQHLFRELMIVSNSGVHIKQLRNDVLMICLRIIQLCPDAPFIETGFFGDICTYATYNEESVSHIQLQSLTDSMQHLKLSKDHEDFELKKSFICMLTSLGTNPAAAKIMAAKKVMRALLSFVIQNDKANADWNSAQFEELQLLTLSCLCTIAPSLTVGYMTCQGNTRLLMLVEWAIKNDMPFAGHGNSFHGEGGRGCKVAQLRYCLRLLLSMCNCGDDAILQDMHEQGAIPMLISILKNFRNIPKVHSDDPVLLEMQADILLILACICEMDMHKKELFGGYDGVRVLVSYLKDDTSKFESGLGHGRLLLAATDCVWCSVIGNTLVEDIFLENEGAFVLLDLLKVCPVNVKNLVLGVLVDLCENHKAVHHVASWKTVDGCTTWSLLTQLWRAEEWDMEVPRVHLSTLAGTSQPLVGKEQNDCGVPPIPTHCPSASITDVTENMRAKIYTLCCKMGFQFLDDELSLEDRITTRIIESYLDFKTGEVWYEVAGELAQEGLRPVTPDQECLTEIMQAHETKAEKTLKQQHELIEQQLKTEAVKEMKYYDKIREHHHATENSKLEFKKFVERTSNYDALKRAKARQLNSLDASRRSCVAIGDRFHSIENSRMNTTTMCGRHITISTTPRKLLIAPVVPPITSPLDQEISET